MNVPLTEIAAAIRAASRIAVTAHVRPDGDAVGSLLGLVLSLRSMGKQVTAILEDVVPSNLTFLPGTETVIQPDASVLDIDLAIALDTATHERIGEGVVKAFSAAPKLVNIDHHGTNTGYGDLAHIDTTSPAAGQIVYDLLIAGDFPIDDAVRQNLFVAISTDTGSFQFSSTNARTHRIAAEMLEAGLDTARLATLCYQSFPKRRIDLQRAMLNEMAFRAGDRIASWNLTQKLMREIQMQPGDTEGLIDTMRSIDSVVACVIFEELENGKIRASSRSKDARVNVSNVCVLFGGGGHPMAAGARLRGPIEEAASRFLSALEDEVRRLD
jgi:phosphoesterase RecJ-like protein